MIKKILQYFFKNSKKENISSKREKKFGNIKFIKLLSVDAAMDDYIHMKELPTYICESKNLEILIAGSAFEAELNMCNLKKLPKCIGQLKHLKELHLQFNSLTYLPKEIGNLNSLIKLKIGGNQLKTLPKEIGCLKHLEILTLWDNNIVQLPEEITKLINLKGLDLVGNPIEWNHKLTNSQIEWIKTLKAKGCNVNISHTIYEVKKTYYEIRYFFKNKFIEQCGPETLEEFIKKPLPKDVIDFTIMNGNGTIEYDLIKKYKYKLNDNLQELFGENFTDISDNENILDDFPIDCFYHMTHYTNIENILKYGLFSHNNELVEEHIDNEEVNDRRQKIEPIHKKSLHSYVPLYFNPKNPMLYVNKDQQQDIVIFAFSKKLILKHNAIFTDGNAAVKRTKFFNDLNDLDKLNWKCLHSKYWTDFEDGKREIMAEVLIQNKIDIFYLEKIYCYDMETKEYILSIDDNLYIEINKNFYF